MKILNYLIDIILIGYSLYFFIFVILGLFTKKYKKHLDPEKKFAIIVPAHNEEKVIDKLLNNLKKLDYPDELYDVFVVADNCQDHTADIARTVGVNVLERNNQLEKGKGFALQYAFRKLGFLSGVSQYDAAVVFDADNLVKENL